MHGFRSRQRKQPCKKATLLGTASGHSLVNLPGWCWAEIQQFALVGSSSSLHSEACNALGASDGVIHSSISREVDCMCASTNKHWGKATLGTKSGQRNISLDYISDDLLFGMLSLQLGIWKDNLIRSTQRTSVGRCQCKAMFVHPEGVLLLAECQARATLQST